MRCGRAAKVLAVEDDIRIVGQPQSRAQMLHALEHLRAHVLMVSTDFLALTAEIKALTEGEQGKRAAPPMSRKSPGRT